MDTPTEYMVIKKAGALVFEKDEKDTDKVTLYVAQFDVLSGAPIEAKKTVLSLKQLEADRDWNLAEVARIDAMIADFKAAK